MELVAHQNPSTMSDRTKCAVGRASGEASALRNGQSDGTDWNRQLAHQKDRNKAQRQHQC